jgi:reversibly glycosylated polypeptide / UDP-arabinopyranose mutase
MADTALVVPSIRKECFERFVAEWRPTGLFDRVDLVLMEDNVQKTFETPPEATAHLCWEDIDNHDCGWIIPRRSDTVRSYAYWWAWDKGYDFLQTLDDDCFPEPGYENLDELHKSLLTRTKWFNTLNSVRPRGTPYYNTGKREVHINHGLWTGVLDYDAPQQLVNPVPEVYTHDNRIVPQGTYHSFCGMNAMWRREAMVLSYHMLMGQLMLDNGQLEKLPFDRFGDIWCGIIQKKICDHLRWSIGSGTPYIHHDRASNPFTNLRKEANGIEVNEWFWQRIDEIKLTAKLAPTCYKQVANAVRGFGGEHAAYWDRLGDAMDTWAGLFL